MPRRSTQLPHDAPSSGAPSSGTPSSGTRWRGSALWRRWTLLTFIGEAVGFLVPVFVVVSGADDVTEPLRTLLLVAAGAGEAAVLATAQTVVLSRALPASSSSAWIARTAAAGALAWAVGLAPSALGEAWTHLPVAAKVGLAAPAGLALLLSIGTAQWTVLRRHVPHAGRWIVWTAAAWLGALAVFLLVATPLWQPGQSAVVIGLIGVVAGGLMALTMAAITGWGLVRLIRTFDPARGPIGTA